MSDARQAHAERRMPGWLPGLATALALAGLVAYSFAQRWAVLAATPFPVGVDGYFYAGQLRALLETGALEYPASPGAFYLMAPLAAATDPITGAKLGAALFGALVALPAYGVGARLGGGRGPGLVAAALATMSAGSAYLTIEFVKNGVGITVALAALWLVLRALEHPARVRIGLGLAGIVAAVLTHKLAGGLVLAIALPAAVAEARGRGVLRGRRLLLLAGWVAVAALALLVAGLLAPRRFLSPADARLLADLVTSDARWSAPVLATEHVTLRLGYEPLLGLGLGVAAALALWLERRTLAPGVRVAGTVVVALAIGIGLPWLDVGDNQGLAMRLRIVAFVPMALCAALVLRVVLARAVPLVATEPGPVRALACAVLALACALRVPGSRTEGLVVADPAFVTAALALAGRVPEGDTVIIPERHIGYLVAYHARVPFALRPEGVPVDRRWRAIPGWFVGIGSPLDDALLAVRERRELPPVTGLHARHPNGFVLVPEVTWQHVVQRLPSSERGRALAWETR